MVFNKLDVQLYLGRQRHPGSAPQPGKDEGRTAPLETATRHMPAPYLALDALERIIGPNPMFLRRPPFAALADSGGFHASWVRFNNVVVNKLMVVSAPQTGHVTS
jgi:hypothetical protein